MRRFTERTVEHFLKDYEVYPYEMLEYILRVGKLKNDSPPIKINDTGKEPEEIDQEEPGAVYIEVPTFLLNHYRQEGYFVPAEMYLKPDETGVYCWYDMRERDERDEI